MILHRIPGQRFSEVRREWSGATAAIIAGGPSLTIEDVERLRAAHAAAFLKCVAVNDAYLLAPWADVHYAADSHWHAWHTAGIDRFGIPAAEVRARWAAFAGQKCTIQNSGANVADASVHMLRNANFPNHGVGLSVDQRALVTGRNSGFQALNLAILAGATRILLLGFDGKPAQDGRSHWFGAHPRQTPAAAYPLYRQAMTAAERDIEAAGVVVINCSPGSEINSFPKARLEEVL